MNLDAELKAAVEQRDARALSKLIDFLRLRRGMTYFAIRDLARRVTGREISAGEWEALMEDCDDADVDP